MTLATAINRLPADHTLRRVRITKSTPVNVSTIKLNKTETFQEWLIAEGESDNTVKSYLADMRVFERWYRATVGEFAPQNLTSHDIQAWRTFTLARDGEKCRPATWNRRKASISVYITYLLAHGYPSLTAAMRGVKPAEEEERPPRWLNAQELGRLMRGLEQAETRANTSNRQAIARRDVAMMILMLDAGLREEEVINLTGADLTLTERKGEIFVDGKGERRRSVPLCSEARFWLRHYLNSPCLPSKRGEHLFPMTTRQLQKRVALMGLECKIDHLHPHRFRHVSVKRMVRAGVDLETIRKIHGHSRIEITMRYAAVGWEEMEEAVERGSMASLPKGQ